METRQQLVSREGVDTGPSIFQFQLFWSQHLDLALFGLNPVSGSYSSPHYFYYILLIAQTFDYESYHRRSFILMNVFKIADSFFLEVSSLSPIPDDAPEWRQLVTVIC